MKKTIYILALILISIFTLTACSSNFNNKEYDALLNKDNYVKCEVKINYYRIINSGTVDSNYYHNKDVTIAVTFNTLEELNSFRSMPLTSVNNLDDYPIEFTSFKDNSTILYNNKFFEEVKQGDTVYAYLSTYKDNQNYYHYIAGIETENKVYLTFEQGLNGIKIYLDNNKSPFFK